MNEPNPPQWFQARLRWAVMEEASGLNHWREAEHIFLSENHQAAWQRAQELDPSGYYSERARDILLGRKPFDEPLGYSIGYNVPARANRQHPIWTEGQTIHIPAMAVQDNWIY